MRNRNRNERGRGQGSGEKNPPTHVAKVRRGTGETATYERIGAAWAGEDDVFYVRLHGTQVVSEGFSLYPLED